MGRHPYFIGFLGVYNEKNISESLLSIVKHYTNVQINIRRHRLYFIAANEADRTKLPGESVLWAFCNWHVFCTLN